MNGVQIIGKRPVSRGQEIAELQQAVALLLESNNKLADGYSVMHQRLEVLEAEAKARLEAAVTPSKVD